MPLPSSPMGCPMDALLRLLMGPWTTYILWALRQNGSMRFGAIRRTVQGVSAKVLTERLRMLEAAGVIYREYKPRIPPEVVYGLTPRGRQLGPILDNLYALAQKWNSEDVRSTPVPAESGARPRHARAAAAAPSKRRGAQAAVAGA
jgi:DNA-binding HxlR family transcriptional regulator